MVDIWRRLRIFPSFFDRSGDLVMALADNFRVKIGEISLLTYIRRLGILKRCGISQFRFQKFIVDNLATSCKHLENFGQVSWEFGRPKSVHLFVDQQFSHVR